MALRAWVQAARPLAHVNLAPPIVLGVALAHADGALVEPRTVAAALGFGVVDHLAIVFANDYADRDGDARHPAPTLFSGGSRVIPDGLLDPRAIRAAAIGSAISLGVGSVLGGLALDRPALPLLALLALALLHAYSFAPLRLSYRGGGELLQGLGVGAVLPCVGYSCATGRLADVPWLALAPLVLLGAASNVLTSLPDLEADRAVGKATWPVRRGERRARAEVLFVIALALALLPVVSPPLSGLAISATLALPALALGLAAALWREADAARRAACLRFVAAGSGAVVLAQVGWALALFTAGR